MRVPQQLLVEDGYGLQYVHVQWKGEFRPAVTQEDALWLYNLLPGNWYLT